MHRIKQSLLLDIDYSKRIFGLDIIRAYAIITVLFLHLSVANTAIKNLKITNKIFIPLIDGVDVFFVLSGFLIGGILIKMFEKEVTIKSMFHFWIMRWMRTLPNYYIWLTIVFALAIAFGSRQNPWMYYLFIQNFFTNKIDVFTETWSLSVEEWFYLLFPIIGAILLLIKKMSVKYVFLLVFLSFLILGIYTSIHYFDINDCSTKNFLNLRSLVAYRLNSIGFGVLAIVTKTYYTSIWLFLKQKLVFLGVLLLYIATIVLSSMYSIFEYESLITYTYFFHIYISSFSIACLIAFIEDIETKNMFVKNTITYISLLSYSIYLIHGSFLLLIFVVLFKVLHLNSFTLFFVSYIPVLYIICVLNYKTVELRFINKRKDVIKKLNF